MAYTAIVQVAKLFLKNNTGVGRGFSSNNKLIIGCTVGVLSSACQSIGLVLQRKAHLIHQNAGINNTYLSRYKRSLWHIGFLLFIVANIFGSSIQITTLPLIVLSPLQSIGLVFNTLFNSIILNEVFTMYSLIGTILISFGAFLIAFFGGSIAEPEYDLKKFVELSKEKAFLIWVFFNIILLCSFLFWIMATNFELRSKQRKVRDYRGIDRINKLKRKVDLSLSHYEQQVFENNSENFKRKIRLFYRGIEKQCMCLASITLSSISKVHKLLFFYPTETIRSIQGTLYGISSGILSAHSLLLAKSTIEILILTFVNHQVKELNNPTAYVLVITFFVLCLSQLYLLNKGLKYISTSILYPLVFCIYNMISIFNGLIFYQQWNEVMGWNGTLISFGTIFVIAGVFVLSYKLEEEKQQSISAMNTPLLPNDIRDYGSASPLTPRKPQLPFGGKTQDAYDDDDCDDDDDDDADDVVITSIVSLTNPTHPQSPYYDRNMRVMPSASSPTPASEVIGPMFKRTSESLNNAGRKFSYFIRKSVDTFQRTGSNDSNITTTPSKNKKRNLTPIVSDSGSADGEHQSVDEMNEYVSFGSLKDSSSFINNHDSIHVNHVSDISPTISNTSNSGLGILTPLINKINRQASTNTIGSVFVSQQTLPLVGNDNQRFSPFKTLKNFSTATNSSHPITNNTAINNLTNGNLQLSVSPKSKYANRGGLSLITNFTSNSDKSDTFSHNQAPPPTQLAFSSSELGNKLDEDYNPNNSYNYSLNNTIEEIQNQMNAYNYQPGQNRVPPPMPGITGNSEEIRQHSVDNNFNKYSPFNSQYQSLTAQRGGYLNVVKNAKKRNFTVGILKNEVVSLPRAFSYEQNELLQEMKKG